MKTRQFAAWLVVAFSASHASAQAPPNPWWAGFEGAGKAVTVGEGRRLYLYCEGVGAPVVVLDSGLGDGASSWRKVQDQIASKTRVCAYDRAGYGKSDPGPLPRDTQSEVDDLTALLKAAQVPGPYVLVAHSMGSFNVRLFAYRHPKAVSGMVLVDPSADNQTAALATAAPTTMKLQEAGMQRMRACAASDATPETLKTCSQPPPVDLPPELAGNGVGLPGPGYFAAVASEADAFERLDSPETIAAKRRLGSMPLIVLTAADTTKSPGAPPDEVKSAAVVWSHLHDDIAALSSKGVNRTIEGSGHYIQMQKPQIVVDAVFEVVDAVRAR